MTLDPGAYLNRPAKGSLSNYRRRKPMTAPKEDEPTPQVYVRVQIELSYDEPRPDPDGALRIECGAAIRRAIEAKLGSEGLAAQLGDATVSLRSMAMRQEMSIEDLSKPVHRTPVPAPDAQVAGYVHNPTPEQARPAGPEMRPVFDSYDRLGANPGYDGRRDGGAF